MDSVNPMLEAALQYQKRGWWILPLKPKSKVPATKNGHKDATNDAKRITAYWTAHPDHGIGLNLAASGLVAVDIDPRAGGKETLDNVEFAHGELDRTATQLTGRGDGGEHLIFKALPGDSYPGGLGPGVDVKHNGYIVVAPSRHPDTGYPYSWCGFDSRTDDVPARPDWLPKPQRVGDRLAAPDDGGLGAAGVHAGGAAAGLRPHSAAQPGGSLDPSLTDERLDELAEALGSVPSDERSTWIGVGMALHASGHELAFELWDRWSSTSAKYPGTDELLRQWDTFKADGVLTYRWIFDEAHKRGWHAGHHLGPYVEPDMEPDTAAVGGVAEIVSAADLGIQPKEPDPDAATDPSRWIHWPDWHLVPVPPREWVWEHWIGIGHVTLLAARCGVGKSMLSQQLATCVTLGEPCLDVPTRQGRVLGLFCEDDRDELRQHV